MAHISTADGPAITPATDITANIGIRSRDRVVAAHSHAKRARQEFERRSQLLRACLSNEDFLSNKGIGNEIGFHTFCYDPALEFEARALFDTLAHDSAAGKLPCALKVVNLYDVVLAILDDLDVLEAMQEQETDFGSKAVLDDVVDYCQPDVVSDVVLDLTQPHVPGDAILLVGVGEVYPFLRAITCSIQCSLTFLMSPLLRLTPAPLTVHLSPCLTGLQQRITIAQSISLKCDFPPALLTAVLQL